MLLFPNAKINLGLNVTEKRNDGFHNIETCFFPIGWSDALEIIETGQAGLSLTGLTVPGPPDENLCLRAFQLLRRDFHIHPVEIHLHKAIPTGAGLGGGSSDAAFTLLLLNEYFNLMLDETLLSMYAEELGSDCPFFIRNRPSMAYEKGQVLEPLALSLKGFHLYVVYPGIHVSTREAYSGIRPEKRERPLKDILLNEAVENWKEQVVNDFEKTVFALHPELKTLKENLYKAGALYASMTGSGSAVFAIAGNKLTPSLPANHKVWHEIL